MLKLEKNISINFPFVERSMIKKIWTLFSMKNNISQSGQGLTSYENGMIPKLFYL